MTTPRPDQRHQPGHAGTAGSRSGAGDTAAALGFPGVPPAVVNCQTFSALKRSETGSPHTLGTFLAAGRIWCVVLSYSVRSGSSYSAASSPPAMFAAVETVIGGLTLATVNIGIAAPSQVITGQSEPPIPGIPVTQGETVILDVNSATSVANVLQFAGAIVYYSIP